MTLEDKIDLLLYKIEQLERDKTPEVLTVADCAKFLRKSESVIRLWVNKKDLLYYKRNGSIFFLKGDLIAWIKRGRIKTTFERYSELILSDKL